MACGLAVVPSAAPAVGQLPLNSLNGDNGFIFQGEGAGDFAGFSLSGIGDFNGDGIEDFVVGADAHSPSALRSAAGAAYVVFGKPGGFTSSLALSSLNGANGFKIIGENQNDYAGISVAGAGDFNGDGYDDLIVGAHRAESGLLLNVGKAYVIFGGPTAPAAVLDLATLSTSQGIRLTGVNQSDASGSFVASAGDFNGDGFTDVLIGSHNAAVGANAAAGKAYMVFGSASPSHLSLSSLNGANGFRFEGASAVDYAGWMATGLGDINGDGLDDIAISAIGADVDSNADAGIVYIVFGTKSNLGASIGPATLNGTNGFRIRGGTANQALGFVAAAGGDINGDGFNDILLSTTEWDSFLPVVTNKYIVHGRQSGFGSTFDISSLDASTGTVLTGLEADFQAGRLLAGAGDVNQDGYADFLVGRPTRAGSVNFPGEAYLVYGGPALGASKNLTTLGDSEGIRYAGIDNVDFAGVSVSAAGDVNNDGVPDILVGAMLADPNGNQSGEGYAVFGGGGSADATYKTFVASGNAPAKGVGLIGDGTSTRPGSRFWIDYPAGTGSGNGNASLETVQLIRENAPITDTVYTPPTVWNFSTTRTGWGSANATIRYLDSEVAGFEENDLVLWRASSPAETWSIVEPLSVDTLRNEITFSTSQSGYFAVAGRELPAIFEVVTYDFEADMNGWIYLAIPPYAEPAHQHANGVLELTAVNTTEITVGSWVTAFNHSIPITPFDPMSDATQTGELKERESDHYLVRYWMKRSVADPAEVPLLRLRVNSSNFQHYHSLDYNNAPDNQFLPSAAEFTALDLLFQPHPYMSTLPGDQLYYYAAFDIISFPNGADPAKTGAYQLDKVEVFRIPRQSVKTVTPVKSYDFTTDGQKQEWTSFSFAPTFAAPTFSSEGTRLAMAAPNPDSAFGTWQNNIFTIGADVSAATGKLFMKSKWRAGSDEPNPLKVPHLRYRSMPQNFHVVAVTGSIDIPPGDWHPKQGDDRIFYGYLEVPPVVDGGIYWVHAAWDIMSFESFASEEDRQAQETSSLPAFVDELDFDLVRIDGYPMP